MMKVVNKKLLFKLAFVLVLGIFITKPKVAYGLEKCDNVAVTPGRVASQNRITIFQNGIGKNNIYVLRSGSLGKTTTTANQNGFVEFTLPPYYFYVYGGDYPYRPRITLSQENGSNICESTINIEKGGCQWSVSPENPYLNNAGQVSITITLKPNSVPPSDKYTYRLVRLNETGEEMEGEKNKPSLLFTAKRSGTHFVKLYNYSGGIGRTQELCATAIDVGEDKDNPGDGLSDIEDIVVEAYDLCQNNPDDCVFCLAKGNAWTALGCIPTDPEQLIKDLFPFLLGLGGLITFGFMVFGGVQIITSTGDPEKIQSGKKLITSAITGLLFIVLSLFLLRLIGVKILELPGLE